MTRETEYNVIIKQQSRAHFKINYLYGAMLITDSEGVEEILNTGQQAAFGLGRSRFKIPAKKFEQFLSKRQKAVA